MAGFSSGKISVENVDLDSSQTLENKTLDASNDFSGDIINPGRSDVKKGTTAELEAYKITASATNGQLCYDTDRDLMFQIINNELVSVGGGSSSLDAFYVEDFEGQIAPVDFTSGNDAIFGNGGVLAGALADDITASRISGSQSLKYTQAAGSLNDFIKSPLIPIDKKQQGNTVGLELYYTYSGNDGDLRIVGYDDTGSEVMTIASNTLRAASKAQRFSVQFPVPSGSANLAWGIQVGVENNGAILVIDDVQMSTNPFVSKELLDEPVIVEGAGNAGQGISVSAGIPFISSKDTTSSWSGTQFTVPETGYYTISGNVALTAPAAYTLSIYIDSSSYRVAGFGYAGYNVSSFDFTDHLIKGQVVDLRPNTALTVLNSTGAHTIHIQKTPTATEHIVAYNSRNAENSMIRLHTGNGHGSTNTKIRRFSTEVSNLGNAITYADSATLGASFTINEDGVYMISYNDGLTSSAVTIGISLNSTELSTGIASITNTADRLNMVATGAANYTGACSWSGSLEKGDILRLHGTGTENFTNSANFTISKIGVGDLLGVPVSRTAYIKDVKASGTNGGTFTAGSYQTRDLNTLEGDTEFLSLSANQLTLQPGKYEIESLSMAFAVDSNIAKLRNITDSTDDIIGMPVYMASTDGISLGAPIIGVIEITSATTYEIQHRCETTRSTNGFGARNVFGVDNTYTTVKIKKIS